MVANVNNGVAIDQFEPKNAKTNKNTPKKGKLTKDSKKKEISKKRKLEQPSTSTQNQNSEANRVQVAQTRDKPRSHTEVVLNDGEHIIKIDVDKGEDNFGTESEDSNEDVPQVSPEPPMTRKINAIDQANNNTNVGKTAEIFEEGEIYETNEPNASRKEKEVANRVAEFNPEIREQIIGEAVSRMESVFERSGIFETASLIKKHFSSKNSNILEMPTITDDNQSEIMIYCNAVQNLCGKRISSLSEDDNLNDTSDDNNDFNNSMTNPNLSQLQHEKLMDATLITESR